VLENGNVAESGTPDELKQQKGIFEKMVERQMQPSIPIN
jgi:ABC-type multidrug transport system fused ATPase/permease subunit